MKRTDQISELLLQWEELREGGKPLPAEELCKGFPELLSEVKQKIQDLESMRHWLGVENPCATADTAGNGRD